MYLLLKSVKFLVAKLFPKCFQTLQCTHKRFLWPALTDMKLCYNVKVREISLRKGTGLHESSLVHLWVCAKY